MKFDDILKYQSTDIKLRRVYDEIEKSDMHRIKSIEKVLELQLSAGSIVQQDEQAG